MGRGNGGRHSDPGRPPGYTGQYLWNYNVTNLSFGSVIDAFAIPVEDPGMISNIGSSAGWTGLVSTLTNGSGLVSWGGGPLTSTGDSADFWFSTAPTGSALTSGTISNPGLTAPIIAPIISPAIPPLVVPVAAPAVNPFIVTTEKDVVDDKDGLTSLREALNTANLVLQGQSRITFANTVAGKTITLTNTLYLDQNIVIDGLGKNITITRDATLPNFRLFQVWDGANSIASFIGLKFQGGRGTDLDKGGAILADGSGLTLQDCTLSDNKAQSGGGIAVLGGTLDVVNCLIKDNEAVADDGGGIFIGSAVTVANITGTEILNNTAAHDGGGIMVWGLTSNTSLTLNHVTVVGNQAQTKGGGICIDDADNPQLTLIGGTFIGFNTLTGANSKGGGLYLGNGSVVFNGVTFDTNTASLGTGFYAAAGTHGVFYPGGVFYVFDSWDYDDEFAP